MDDEYIQSKFKQYKLRSSLRISKMESTTLQQKQTYLRNNIEADHYEDFYQFCQRSLGTVDINSWTMTQVLQIVQRFKKHMQDEAVKNTKKLHHSSYNQYQSRSADIKNDQNQPEQSQISECQSSKVVKSSAVELLDEVLSSQSFVSTKTQPQKNTPAIRNSINSQTRHDGHAKSSSISFEQFQFWTSTMPSPTNQKIQQEVIRNKSSSQYRSSKTPNLVGTPPATKNAFNTNDFNFNNNSQSNASMNININITEPTRNRYQTQSNFKNVDFDIFANSVQTDAAKKSSPYMKKEAPQEVYEGSKAGVIRLKQVRQYDGPHRGMSVNIDKGRVAVQPQVPFEEVLMCYKSAIRHQLSDKTLNVFIDKHEIIERKFLAADYAMYNVKIVPLGIQCKRNYDDFSKLRANLSKFFPGIHLPYLEETSWLSGTNIDFINTQKKMLELFTRDLIRNKELRNSRVMQDFLTLKDHKAIKRKFEKYEQMEQLKGLQQLCLLDGKVKVTINSEQNSYIQNLQKFLQKMSDLFERQEKLTQTLIDQYNDLMRTFKSLMNLMEQMQKQIKQFNTKATVNTIKYLGHSVRILRQTYNQQFANIKFDHEINTKKIVPFLRYERKNFLELHKLIEIEKKLKKSLDKRSLTEKIGVGESYMSESVKGTKKSILTQSDSLIVLKYQVGYFGHQTRNQAQRVFDELAVKMVGRWKSLGQSYLNKLTNSVDYWKGLTNTDIQTFRTQLTF